MSRTKRLLCILVTVGMALAGCGGDDDQSADPQASGTTAPCQLLTQADAAAALGTTVGAPESGSGIPTSVVGERVCQFKTTDPARPSSLVRLGLSTGLAPEVFQKFKTRHPQAASVPNLGASAVWDDPSRTVVVLEEDKVLSVVVFGGGVRNHREVAIQLATKALQRL